MTESNDQPSSPKFDINTVIAVAKEVITTPAAYFQRMPKSGGFSEPLIFVVVMALAAGIIAALLSFTGSATGMLAYGFGAIIFLPVGAIIGVFIGSAILFVVWKLMGSEENYETAFRCLAAITAIYPITAVLSLLPYVGAIIGIAWSSYLLIEASVAVHGRDKKTATIVFGILGALMIFSNLSSEYAARQMGERMEAMGGQFEDFGSLSPEEQGKRMGEFVKGMESGMKKEE